MALEELSEAKRKALRAEIFKMTQAGKSVRQVARMALKKFNVKLTLPKNDLL
jgi:hypothetical protein